tara:strand:+ start:582 stop:740 length:159 start_codon:yes stop_codon:yes gene_type:complete
MKMKGLGDVIDLATTVTGVKAGVKAVSKMTGKSCGCEERRDTLNRKYPFTKE